MGREAGRAPASSPRTRSGRCRSCGPRRRRRTWAAWAACSSPWRARLPSWHAVGRVALRRAVRTWRLWLPLNRAPRSKGVESRSSVARRVPCAELLELPWSGGGLSVGAGGRRASRASRRVSKKSIARRCPHRRRCDLSPLRWCSSCAGEPWLRLAAQFVVSAAQVMQLESSALLFARAAACSSAPRAHGQGARARLLRAIAHCLPVLLAVWTILQPSVMAALKAPACDRPGAAPTRARLWNARTSTTPSARQPSGPSPSAAPPSRRRRSRKEPRALSSIGQEDVARLWEVEPSKEQQAAQAHTVWCMLTIGASRCRGPGPVRPVSVPRAGAPGRQQQRLHAALPHGHLAREQVSGAAARVPSSGAIRGHAVSRLRNAASTRAAQGVSGRAPSARALLGALGRPAAHPALDAVDQECAGAGTLHWRPQRGCATDPRGTKVWRGALAGSQQNDFSDANVWLLLRCRYWRLTPGSAGGRCPRTRCGGPFGERSVARLPASFGQRPGAHALAAESA